MNILHLCKKFPWPAKDGETIAIRAMSEALHASGAELWLLAMNTTRHFSNLQTEHPLPQGLAHYREVKPIAVDNRIRITGAIANLCSRDPYHVSRFQSADFRDALVECLHSQSFDIAILETLYLAPYVADIRKHSKAKIVLRAHNVESEVWARVAANMAPGPRRAYLHYLVRKLRRYEQEMLNHFDLIAAITARDLEQFRTMGFQRRGIVVPVGINLREYPPAPSLPEGPLRLGFIGSLDWAPNAEGLRQFLKDSWPRIHSTLPTITLEIAGRNAPDWLLSQTFPGVKVLGEVSDARAFIQHQHLMIAPLYAGGGVRVKILEAMALGIPTLNTRLAIEGIPASDRRDTLLADTPDEFVHQLHFALQHPENLSEIATRARGLIEAEFDQQKIGQRLLSALS